jgi:hypothetical protein
MRQSASGRGGEAADGTTIKVCDDPAAVISNCSDHNPPFWRNNIRPACRCFNIAATNHGKQTPRQLPGQPSSAHSHRLQRESPPPLFLTLRHEPAPLLTCTQVIDEEGVNRTPKPLTAIVPSIALRQAKLAEDGNMLGGEVSCDGLADRGLLSSSGFSRGWFSEAPSGAMTPSGDGRASEAGGGLKEGRGEGWRMLPEAEEGGEPFVGAPGGTLKGGGVVSAAAGSLCPFYLHLLVASCAVNMAGGGGYAANSCLTSCKCNIQPHPPHHPVTS